MLPATRAITTQPSCLNTHWRTMTIDFVQALNVCSELPKGNQQITDRSLAHRGMPSSTKSPSHAARQRSRNEWLCRSIGDENARRDDCGSMPPHPCTFRQQSAALPSMSIPSFCQASSMTRVSSLSSTPVKYDGPCASAAMTNARLVRLLLPGGRMRRRPVRMERYQLEAAGPRGLRSFNFSHLPEGIKRFEPAARCLRSPATPIPLRPVRSRRSPLPSLPDRSTVTQRALHSKDEQFIFGDDG